MLVSKNWLQDFIEEKLPETDKLSEGIIMHAFEIESFEKVGDDEVFDIKILPDRNHYALSHRGIAKEICAIFDLTFKDIVPKIEFPSSEKLDIKIEDEKLCRRYCGAHIKNIKIGESPSWLRERLEAIGQKSINNIVDITNYIMYGLGQPLHAFDADKLVGGITARAGKEGEVLNLIDATGVEDKKGRVIELGKGECVIADESGPLVLAGIKGGVKTAISTETKNIIIEAANFDPVITRKFSGIYNLRNESSKRFENEITPDYAWDGLQTCVDLVLKIAGGELEGVKDVYPNIFSNFKVGVSSNEIERLLGVKISDSDIQNIFKKFNFKFEKIYPLNKIISLVIPAKAGIQSENADLDPREYPRMTNTDEVMNAEYKYGASVSKDSPRFFDCSSLTSWLYVQGGIALPRMAVDQFVFTERIEKDEVQAGDLIFVDTHIEEGSRKDTSIEFAKGTKISKIIDHVGMYLGGGKVLHAAKSFGKVVVENLEESVWFKDVVGYGRACGINDERYVIDVPTDRFDIRIKEDLIEEIGRIYGYEHIESKRPELIENKNTNKKLIVESIIREHLVASGFSELLTYTFQPKGDLEVLNALANDKSFIRNSISNQLADALIQNARYADLLGLSKIKIFEMGAVFTKEGEGLRLAIGVSFAKKIKGETPESEIGNVFKEICKLLKIDPTVIIPNPALSSSGTPGDLSCILEVDLQKMIDLASGDLTLPDFIDREIKKYKPISAYPFSVRDIAVWTDGEGNEVEIENIIKKHSGNLLQRISLFDIFSKDGKTSYAYRLVLQSMEKTLEEAEINEIINKITEDMNAKEGWQVR